MWNNCYGVNTAGESGCTNIISAREWQTSVIMLFLLHRVTI